MSFWEKLIGKVFWFFVGDFIGIVLYGLNMLCFYLFVFLLWDGFVEICV